MNAEQDQDPTPTADTAVEEQPVVEGQPIEAGASDADPSSKKKKKKDKDKKKDGLGTSRGIETMFRTSYRVHMDLSSLADSKANIMISINGLIISITLAAFAPNIARNGWVAIPTIVLLAGCSASLVYAVLAARPRVSSRALTLDDIHRNDANILFFGNFVNLSEGDFVEGMKDLMLDTEHLYTNMIRDLYGLGSVLQRKFQLLRISYNVFMVALVLGVLLSIAVFMGDTSTAREILETPGFPG